VLSSKFRFPEVFPNVRFIASLLRTFCPYVTTLVSDPALNPIALSDLSLPTTICTWRRLLRVTVLAGTALSFIGCGNPKGAPSAPNEAISITMQPLSQTVPIGGAATFTVAATGTPPLSYQWSEDGVEIPGVIGTSYSTPVTQPSAGGSTAIGSFQVKVSSAGSSIVSNAATLTAGPRSPKVGDLRYLLWQQVDVPSLFNKIGSGVGEVEVNPGSIIDTVAYNALGTPLGIGSSFACGAGSCTYRYLYQPLPPAMTALNFFYQGGNYSSYISNLQSYTAPNIVITSLDLEPAEDAYAVSWVQTTQAGGFDYRLDPVVPAGTGQQAQIQAQATLDGKESRIVTAVSFDASGNAILISYGWTGDTTTVYETQTIVVPQQNQISSAVSSAATTLANAGYFISAFGGNDTDGYILIGGRVQGDNLPRPIIQISTATQPPYPTPVVYLDEGGPPTLLTEQ
jgi:hypothetical protein